MTVRPCLLLGLAGTGTDVGKTWTAARLAERARAAGWSVAARKPVQSFEPGTVTDAALLARATGAEPDEVCPPARCYELPMAPPMAAAALGRPRIAVAGLLEELVWPEVDLGLLETVGGVRSPVADDADSALLLRLAAVDRILLVADAGLGTINLVRLSVGALAPMPVVVFLNRFDEHDPLHAANRDWLRDRDGLVVLVDVDAVFAWLVSGQPA